MFVVRLLSVVVKFGLATAVIVGGVYVYENRESIGEAISGSSPAPIDYNCSLPGSGFPWLEHEPVPDPPHGGAPLHMGGIFVSTVPRPSEPGWGVELPVRIREDGTPLPSMADVYRMLCTVHPDLGGSGVRPMTPEEKRSLDCCDPDPVQRSKIPYLYTDGVMRAADEAHLGFERIRVYLLPPIPKDLLDALATSVASRQTATPTATPTPTPQQQRWKVSVSGWYLEELDYYWSVKHGHYYGGVHFDWNLQAEVVLRQEKGRWVYETGVITYASVTPQPFYAPANAWELELPLECRGCDGIKVGRRLKGDVSPDNDLHLSWGVLNPEVPVNARLLPPFCETGCLDAMALRYFDSGRFLEVLNSHWLPLKEGVAESEIGLSPQGVKNLSYTVDLTRLDK